MHSINVISYNMGTNIRDFSWECDYLGQKIDDGEEGQRMYKEAQENTTKSQKNVLLWNFSLLLISHTTQSPTSHERFKLRQMELATQKTAGIYLIKL